jgi:Mrp family chromosome partitioning ATPase
MTMSTQINSLSETQVAASSAVKPHGVRRAAQPPLTGTGIPHRLGAEYFDNLLWRIESLRLARGSAGFLLGLTGCDPRAGVSTVAANLAIRAADHGRGRVLLADVNIHRPGLHKLFRSKQAAGLADVLIGQAKFEDCIHTTSIFGLSFLPLGAAQHLTRLRAARGRMEAVAADLRDQFDLVVCDLPVAAGFGPLVSFAGMLDAALLVVRSEHARRESAKQAVRRLVDDGMPLAGAVLTDTRSNLPRWLERVL